MRASRPVYFEGGPWDGHRRIVRGHPLRLYVPEQPGIDFAQFPPRDPASPLVRKTHVYTLMDDGNYLYKGIE